MKVKVTHTAFFGGMRRRVGEVLEVPDGTRGTWFTEVPAKGASVEPAEKPKRGKAPAVALSELGKEKVVGPLDTLV